MYIFPIFSPHQLVLNFNDAHFVFSFNNFPLLFQSLPLLPMSVHFRVSMRLCYTFILLSVPSFSSPLSLSVSIASSSSSAPYLLPLVSSSLFLFVPLVSSSSLPFSLLSLVSFSLYSSFHFPFPTLLPLVPPLPFVIFLPFPAPERVRLLFPAGGFVKSGKEIKNTVYIWGMIKTRTAAKKKSWVRLAWRGNGGGDGGVWRWW